MDSIVVRDNEAAEIVRLRREIAGLEQELEEAKDAATVAKQASADAIAAIRALRKQVQPFYDALRMIMGEITRVEAEAVTSTTGPVHSAGRDPRWDSWKVKLPGRPAEFIDLLLEHREMTGRQLAAAARCDPRTVTRAIFVLNKAQLINKNGGKFSLKEL
jgi:hypothetical protein